MFLNILICPTNWLGCNGTLFMAIRIVTLHFSCIMEFSFLLNTSIHFILSIFGVFVFLSFFGSLVIICNEYVCMPVTKTDTKTKILVLDYEYPIWRNSKSNFVITPAIHNYYSVWACKIVLSFCSVVGERIPPVYENLQ